MSSPFLSASELSTNDSTLGSYQLSPVSNDDNSSYEIAIKLRVSNINSPSPKKCKETPLTFSVDYGPISIRKRNSVAPTLATGRRPKDAVLQGEEAAKREVRRMKNRESARNLKILRDKIEKDLKTKLEELECKERELLLHIETLQSYKKCLEGQCQQSEVLYDLIIRRKEASSSENELNSSQTSEPVSINSCSNEKHELTSPSSPPWQLLFGI